MPLTGLASVTIESQSPNILNATLYSHFCRRYRLELQLVPSKSRRRRGNMSATMTLVSVGDEGVLNEELSPELSNVWIDRDISWLDFNERVLAEALDERTPLLERARFLAIFTSNLDEFFMKRMAALRAGATEQQRDLLARLRAKLLPSLRRQGECYRQVIVPGLARHGVALRCWDDLTPGQQREAGDDFDSNLSPALTPLVI